MVASTEYINSRFGDSIKTKHYKPAKSTKNKVGSHEKRIKKLDREFWSIADHDPLKYKEITRYTTENYYIYVENLEAEKQRQLKANKKWFGDQ